MNFLKIPLNFGAPTMSSTYLDIVEKRVDSSDGMYQGNDMHYLKVGASALHAILSALSIVETNSDNIDTILDFGCGAGRVSRWIKAAFPSAKLVCAEVDINNLEFLRTFLNIDIIHTSKSISELKIEGFFDLIFVGSVFTHLSKEDSEMLFIKLMNVLNKGGVLVFTTHGKIVFDNYFSGRNDYGLRPQQMSKIKDDYLKHGYGYDDYYNNIDYGISVGKLSFWANLIENTSNTRLVLHCEKLWDNHQDVIAVEKI